MDHQDQTGVNINDVAMIGLEKDLTIMALRRQVNILHAEVERLRQNEENGRDGEG